MSTSREMTLEWLQERNFRTRKAGTHLADVTDINAHWILFDQELDQVPKTIFEKFLLIENENGITTLQLLLQMTCREQLSLVPPKLFTVHTLTNPLVAGRVTPVELIAAAGHLDLIPLELFAPSQWVRHIITLHKAAARFVENHSQESTDSNEGYQRLCKFILEVEKVQKIKEKPALRMK